LAQDIQAEQIRHKRIGRTGQAEQDRQKRTSRTGQVARDIYMYNGTDRAGRAKQERQNEKKKKDRQNGTSRTGQEDWTRRTGQGEKDFQYRPARKKKKSPGRTTVTASTARTEPAAQG
jgi:hypothetical protein